ncbi:MAG: PKD domain-containing protein [Flavobacteriales bacterium]|nr:PKD domain-containing protein [Flavobacteriales bacterium]
MTLLDHSFRRALSLFGVLSFTTGFAQGPSHSAKDHGPSVDAPVLHGEYVENKGQWAPQIMYRADFGLVAMFAEKDRLVFSKLEDGASDKVHDAQHEAPEAMGDLRLKGHAWYAWFEGANVNAQIERDGRSSDYFNYIIGNDPTKWASDVRHFEEVRYKDLWPGVDLRLHEEDGGFKYDVLAADAEAAAAVQFRYEGLDLMAVGAKGELILRTSVGELQELAPVAWYADGAKEPVACSFTLRGTRVGFAFGKGTNRGRPIVIDPTLIASTLSGTGNIGTTQNYGHTATYDDAGNIYTGAICFGQGYPTTPGAFDGTHNGGIDIAVSKLDPTGSNLLFATYLGGSAGDYPHSLVVNVAGELTVYGSTSSSNYPVSANAYDPTFNGGNSDIVVTKLNPTGTALVGSTYMGSPGNDGQNGFTSNYGDFYRGEVITDVSGKVYVSSCSDAAGFPTTPGAFQPAHAGLQDGVVFCLSPDLSSLLWSTYFGTPQPDMCFGIKLNSSGQPYVCGGTSGATLPVSAGAFQAASNGAQEAFIVHFNTNASAVVNCTYFGAPNDDVAFFLQLDLEDNAYIFGQSPTGDLGIAPAGTYGDATGGIFVAELDATLSTQVFRTMLGPGGGGWGASMVPVAFLVDVCRNIYISGYSVGTGWTTTASPLYTSGGFYLATYEPDMTNIIYGTYYEGAGHVDGGTSRFDANGKVYQAVCTSGGFPTTPGAWSNVQPSGWDIGVFKIDFDVSGVNAAGASTLNEGCAPIVIDFSNNSTGDSWIWDFGDGSPTEEAFAPSHSYTTPGAFTVTLIAQDSLSCNLADTTYLEITIGEQQPIDADFSYVQTIDCTLMEIATTNLSTGDPLTWYWDMGDGTQYVDTNVVHQFPGPGSYLVQLIAEDPTGCSGADTVQVQIDISPPLQVDADFTLVEDPGCDELTVTCTDQSTAVTPSYAWDMGDGTLYTTPDVSHLFQAVGTYTISLIVTDTASCNVTDTMTVDVTVLPSLPVAAAFTAAQAFDCDDLLLTTDNQSTGTNLVFDWQLSDGSQYVDTNVTHVLSGTGTYTITLTVSDALGCSPPQTASMDVQIDPLVPVLAAFTAEQVNDCALLNVSTLNQSTGDSVSYSWDMGDGTVITALDVTHAYTLPGQYTITLTVTDLGCGQDDQAIMNVTLMDVLPIHYVGDTVICPDDVAELNILADAVSYLWSTGETTPAITVDVPGTYTVTVSDGLCIGTASVDVIAAPRHQLYDSLFACPRTWVDLRVPIDGLAFSWVTGGNERVERVWGEGLYTYDMIDLWGCPYSDSLKVIALDSMPQIFAPNAFTPNGDGRNDTFRISGFGENKVSMMIFDRWGEQLWANEGMDPYWDGQYQGKVVKDGVYVYLLKYTGTCRNEEVETIGHVTVLR